MSFLSCLESQKSKPASPQWINPWTAGPRIQIPSNNYNTACCKWRTKLNWEKMEILGRLKGRRWAKQFKSERQLTEEFFWKDPFGEPELNLTSFGCFQPERESNTQTQNMVTGSIIHSWLIGHSRGFFFGGGREGSFLHQLYLEIQYRHHSVYRSFWLVEKSMTALMKRHILVTKHAEYMGEQGLLGACCWDLPPCELSTCRVKSEEGLHLSVSPLKIRRGEGEIGSIGRPTEAKYSS